MENENIYDSDIDYLYDSKDKPSWKILYYMYLDQGSPDKLVITLQKYKAAKLYLYHKGAIKEWQYKNSSFIRFLNLLVNYHMINSLPDYVPQTYIKVIPKEKQSIINEIQEHIIPGYNFKQETEKARIEKVEKEIMKWN